MTSFLLTSTVSSFQKNPSTVWTFAEELGIEIQVANQIRWGFPGRAEIKK
jgi:hypothetical protein